MITRITMQGLASFKNPATLQLSKRINLLYGLNGTGKTTLADFLYRPDDESFRTCTLEGLDEGEAILVYNQRFVEENFFATDEQEGIFTLAKSNRDAEITINNAQAERAKLLDALSKKQTELTQLEIEHGEIVTQVKNKLWEIKTNHAGRGQVLEYCLEGMMAKKESLFVHIMKLAKPLSKPLDTIEDLQKKLFAISGDNAQKYTMLAPLDLPFGAVETRPIFAKAIIGNANSTLAQLINGLGNSDWVKEGLHYVHCQGPTENTQCPFCQEKTISAALIANIKNYFDAAYEADITQLKSFLREYEAAMQEIPQLSVYEAHPKFAAFKNDFVLKYRALMQILENNKRLIKEKINSASQTVQLTQSDLALKDLNQLIQLINKSIAEHNANIAQKEKLKITIKKSFWEIMRWNYDGIISKYFSDLDDADDKISLHNKSIADLRKKIEALNELIVEQQRTTVNIELAITNINNNLHELGITDFKIEAWSENKYRIVRADNEDGVFHSLSEGEKKIISFLYFLELCRGKKDRSDIATKKIIVIDDPVSSLSNIFMTKVARLIKNEFFRDDQVNKGDNAYVQVVILTHNHTFFAEIAEPVFADTEKAQALFRLIKNEEGSSFIPIKFEEI